MITRRRFIKAAALTGIAGALPFYYLRSSYAAYSAEDFTSPLNIPPELHGRLEQGKRVFDLNLQHGTTQFFQGLNTATIGINSAFLGSTIRTNKGEKVVLNVKNQLNENSTLHWHGVHLPAKMDGGPHQVVEKGQTWRPEFEINQPASMQWYHSHAYHRTGVQVYHGLAGLFYIDDPASQQKALPDDYAVNDIPLVIQDRNFNQDGSFRYIGSMHEQMAGIQGSEILVNGVVRPKLNVTHKQTRFRILNGSNARIYNLEFSDQRAFIQIASDGGLLEQPVRLQAIRLAPGERAEIVVNFGNDQDVLLRHSPLPSQAPMQGMMGMMSRMMGGDDRPFNVMRFVSKKPEGDIRKLPAQLAVLPDWISASPDKVRRFDLDVRMGMMGRSSGGNGFTINNASYDPERIDEIVRLNDVEVWEFKNNSPLAHPMHIHDIQFHILTRNGKPPALNERGLKDTVLVNPNETVRVITKFENYADDSAPYMYHCHNLEHEDKGMMGQFLVKA